MNSSHFEHPPRREYPAIELDMTNFMEHLSEDDTSGKIDVGDETNPPNKIDYKTEDCTSLGGGSSFSKSGFKQEEKVRKLDGGFACL